MPPHSSSWKHCRTPGYQEATPIPGRTEQVHACWAGMWAPPGLLLQQLRSTRPEFLATLAGNMTLSLGPGGVMVTGLVSPICWCLESPLQLRHTIPHKCPALTCANKQHIIGHPVQGVGAVHHNLCVVHPTLNEPWLVVSWGHGVIHEWVVLDKLQGFVRQAEGAGEVGSPCCTVNAL